MQRSQIECEIAQLPNTEEELVLLVGQYLIDELKFATVPDKREVKDIANRWIKKQTEFFRQKICKNKLIRQYVENDDLVSIMVEIAMIVLTEYPPIAALPLARILTRRGIANLCKDFWK